MKWIGQHVWDFVSRFRSDIHLETEVKVIRNVKVDEYGGGDAGGSVIKIGSAQQGNFSQLHFLHTDGTWDLVDADTVVTGSNQMLGIPLGAAPLTDGVLIKGYIRIASANLEGTPAVGKAVYASEEPGHFDFTAPSSAPDFVRIVGYCVSVSGSDILLYFNPDNTWVEIA